MDVLESENETGYFPNYIYLSRKTLKHTHTRQG